MLLSVERGMNTSVGVQTGDHASTKRRGVATEHRSTCPQDDLHAPPKLSPSAAETLDRMSRELPSYLCGRHVDLCRYDAICRPKSPTRSRRDADGTIRSVPVVRQLD